MKYIFKYKFENYSLRTLIFLFMCQTFFFKHSLADTPSDAQKLPTKAFQVCGKKVQLEIASNDEQRTIGLMFRQEIPSGTGMIFIFPYEEERAFWMRNVPFDIDIGFFDKGGKLLNFHTMRGTSALQKIETLERYPSKGAAQYAVEVEKGFFSNLKSVKSCHVKPLPKTKN